MPPKGKRKSKPKIEIKESRGFVIGDFATVINNFWDEQVLKRFGLEQRAGFIILFLAVLGVGAGLYFGLRPSPAPPEIMSGDLRIAVAAFAVKGKSPERNLGLNLADAVFSSLETNMQAVNPDLTIKIWGPQKVASVTAETSEGRAAQAEKIARDIDANIVVYGFVDTDAETWQVQPEFYVAAENFYEAREIVGQNDLGAPIEITGASDTDQRKDFGDEMLPRGKVLSAISVGLGYFARKKYEKALNAFQIGLDPDWQDGQGDKVLYVMAAFAAAKLGETQAKDKDHSQEDATKNFDLAEQYLHKARRIDENYVRPYIALANVSYMRALQPSNASKKREDIDVQRLAECFAYLDQAEKAPDKPPLADAETKIHFARGQCLMMDVYSGHTTNFAPAIGEFEQVIHDFGNGANPRIQELAAEAHGRMGLIYLLVGKNEQALQEYTTAASLAARYPDRRDEFLKGKARAEQLISAP